MRYCAWLSELPTQAAPHTETEALARLAQAGLPVLPGWVMLPLAVAVLFDNPEVRTVIRREAKLVSRHPHVVAASTHAVRQQLQAKPLPSDLRHELAQMLQQLRQHLLLPDRSISLRLRMEDTSIERSIADADGLESALKQLYALRIEDRHFLHKKQIETAEAFIHYTSTDDVWGTGHLRDDMQGDENVVQIDTASQMFRIDRRSGHLLTGPSEREISALSDSQLRGLALLIGKAQDTLTDPHAFGWRQLHGRIWLESLQPLAQAKAPLARKFMPAQGGFAEGAVRKIDSLSDRQRLLPGEIAIVERLRETDHAWLSPASAIIAVHGSHYGTSSRIGRHLGIPVVTGVTPAEADSLRNGQFIKVDGHAGTLNTGNRQFGSAGIATKFIVHSEGLELVATAADGLLLAGSTGLLTLHALHPHQILRRERTAEYVDLLSGELTEAAAAIYPKPLFYRFHDGYLQQGGQRGLRAALERPEWMQVELQMLDRATRKGATNIVPLTPLLHDLEDIARLRKAAERYPELLRRLWITCGTPALTIQAEELGAQEISGICLDLSHLAQQTLGVANDGMHSHLAHPDHAAVLQQADYLIATAQIQGISTMIETEGRGLSSALVERMVTAGADYLVVSEETHRKVERAAAEVEGHLLQEYQLAATRPFC